MAVPVPEQWTQPLTPEGLRKGGATAHPPPPAAGHRPDGAWTLTWRVWLLERNPYRPNLIGFLRVVRRPGAESNDEW